MEKEKLVYKYEKTFFMKDDLAGGNLLITSLSKHGDQRRSRGLEIRRKKIQRDYFQTSLAWDREGGGAGWRHRAREIGRRNRK